MSGVIVVELTLGLPILEGADPKARASSNVHTARLALVDIEQIVAARFGKEAVVTLTAVTVSQ